MEQIWSPELGYLGDPLYRAPRRDPRSGLALWCAGEAGAPEALYDPYHAFIRAHEHAQHWAAYVTAELESFRAQHDRPGIVLVPLEAELLGRRWFEGRRGCGPSWRHSPITRPSGSRRPPPICGPIGHARARRRATDRGARWAATAPGPGRRSSRCCRRSTKAEEWLAQLIQRYPQAHGELERILAQALRELLLAQSSDWLLLLNQGAGDEPLNRPAQHLRRCTRLCALAEQAALSEEDRAFLAQIEEEDNPFAYINYRMFTRS